MESINADDELARSIFYGDQFDGDSVGANALVQFKGSSNEDGSFDESLILLRLIPVVDLHEFNCKREDVLNERIRLKRELKGLPLDPVPGVDRKYYCGFTKAEAAMLRAEGANYVVELEHFPEHGIDAHVKLILRPRSNRKIKAADRTEAGRILALAFRDPVPHMCPRYVEDSMHPLRRWGLACLMVA